MVFATLKIPTLVLIIPRRLRWLGFLFVLTAVAASAFEFPQNVQKLFDYQQQLAQSVTFIIAFLAGIITFTSPCGFVILPTFFSYLFKERQRALRMTAMFSAGLSLAFVLMGIIAGIVGEVFNPYKTFFASISGIILTVFGVMMIFNKGFSIFDFKVRHKPNDGYLSVFLLGFLLAVGWTPCVGPVLGSIFVLSANSTSILKSTLLFASYALGVSVPLMLISYFSDKYDLAKFFTTTHRSFSFFGKKIHTHAYNIAAGLILIMIGIIMFIGKGTGFFMDTIPQYLPWTMEWFVAANQKLIEAGLFKSTVANVVGMFLILSIIVLMIKIVGKKVP
ncbi:MAG: cytochrome c biogenesis protein CcdA [Candidatus Aenigmarchaeota archaeon]|nr:cytochrome c biogenesis protein CcdA [Candidatus Aenigmarchaeota archaeon]